MTEQEQYQARLKEIYLIEEARLTYAKLYQAGFRMGAGGVEAASDNLYVASDYCDDYFE